MPNDFEEVGDLVATVRWRRRKPLKVRGALTNIAPTQGDVVCEVCEYVIANGTLPRGDKRIERLAEAIAAHLEADHDYPDHTAKRLEHATNERDLTTYFWMPLA